MHNNRPVGKLSDRRSLCKCVFVCVCVGRNVAGVCTVSKDAKASLADEGKGHIPEHSPTDNMNNHQSLHKHTHAHTLAVALSMHSSRMYAIQFLNIKPNAF